MGRPKNPTFEWVEKLQCYRKRIKDSDGKYFALYDKDPVALKRKQASAEEAIRQQLLAKETPTVAQYAASWLPLQVMGLSASARESYERALRLHILPQIGDQKLREVSVDDVRAILLAASEKSASHYTKVLVTVRGLFRSAEENHLIAASPVINTKSGGAKAQEKKALTDDQVITLLAAVRGTRAEPFVLLGLYAGLRREEILALNWDCVDLNGDVPSLTVRRALRWEQNRPIVSDELKSAAARRTIPLPSALETFLRGCERQEGGYVIGGHPVSQQQFRNLWRLVERRETGEGTYRNSDGEKVKFDRRPGTTSKKSKVKYIIDFPVTPHILRHTYISNLILAGVDIKTVQYLAGHATVQMTLNIYTHLIDNRPQDMLDKVRRAFPGGESLT